MAAALHITVGMTTRTNRSQMSAVCTSRVRKFAGQKPAAPHSAPVMRAMEQADFVKGRELRFVSHRQHILQ